MATDGKRMVRLADAHPDMRRYLDEDCYCPGEIYDVTGFSYLTFSPDDECVMCARTDDMTVVVTTSRMSPSSPQAIMFWHDDLDSPDRIIAAQRVDATENNISILCDIAHGARPDGRKIDRFPDNHTRRTRCDGSRRTQTSS